MRHWLLGLFLAWQGVTAAAPIAVDPCDACDPASRPESGFWHNPDRPGTGLSLRIYGDSIAGTYLGYDRRARVWLTWSAALERMEEAGVGRGWRAGGVLYRPEGLGCIGCEDSRTESATAIGRLEMEFSARSEGRYRLDDGPWIRLQLYGFGVDAHPEFAPAHPYPIPDLDGPWMLAFRDSQADTPQSSHYGYAAWASGDGARDDDLVGYLFTQAETAAESVPVGDLVCRDAIPHPVCVFSQYLGRRGELTRPDRQYFLSIEEITATRFKARARDGSLVEGFAVDKD